MNKKLTCAPFTEALTYVSNPGDTTEVVYNTTISIFLYTKMDIIAPQAQICARF